MTVSRGARGRRDEGAAPTLQFLGGVRSVTGSKFVLRSGGATVMVDCGLFQGLKDLRLRNWEPLGLDPASIDAVVLTHAHLDHCGYLPRLVRSGFGGAVHCTADTVALVGIVLPDSGHLQEEEADYANRRGFSKHRPAQPLSTEADARAALGSLEPAPFGTDVEVAPGVTVRFARAGHILGSATVTVRLADGASVCFSGDLGRANHPLLVPPDPLGDVDWVVAESTYGDRRHHDARATQRLGEVIARTVARGGSVLIPAFAVDRTEVLLVHLARLARAGALPDVPVYVDSPMALSALSVYRRAIERHSADLRADLGGDDPFDVPGLVEVRDLHASTRLDEPRLPSIVISASGMATGGRVVHHLARSLPHRENAIVLIGFQAEGTRGRALAEGAREVKMLGHYVRVRAEVVDLPAFSVHADRDELLAWLGSGPRAPEGVFVVHGEAEASRSLRARIAEQPDWLAVVPTLGETVRLD